MQLRAGWYKESGAFTSTATIADTTAAGAVTQDIGKPTYDIGGSACTNQEKYQTKFFKFEETRAAANTPATYQLQINSSSIPQFKANEVEMYTISKNSVDNYDTEHCMTLDQYRNNYFVLTVPRRIRAGFSDRVLSERQEGDNREDYAREYQTLIQVREAQFHSLLLRYGMQRMGLPGTEEERKRSEFFKGSLVQAKRALKAIGRGDFFEFDSNDITKMRTPPRVGETRPTTRPTLDFSGPTLWTPRERPKMT